MSKFITKLKSVLGLTKDLGSVEPIEEEIKVPPSINTLSKGVVVHDVVTNSSTFRPSNYRTRKKRKRRMQKLSRRSNRC